MEKKTVLITGASGGIGEAIAKEFALKGYNIIYHYNNNYKEDIIQDLAKITNVLPVKANFSKPMEIVNLVNNAINTFGKIDVLINNAGISRVCPIVDEDFEEMEKAITINLTAPAYLTSLVSKYMCQRQSGNIVFVSSIWGVYGGAVESVYSATKAGLIGLTKSLAKELAPNGIRVNAVAPGLIDTKMNNNLSSEEKQNFIGNVALNRIGRPEEVAKAIYYLSSDDSSYINGETLNIDGGIDFGN